MLVWAIALTSYFVHRTRTLRLRRIVAIHWWSLRLTGIRRWAGTTYATVSFFLFGTDSVWAIVLTSCF